MSDKPLERTVHAVAADGTEVVRYDKAGKWYAEPIDGKRRHVTLSEAVTIALAFGSFRDWPRNGGAQFNAEIKKRLRK